MISLMQGGGRGGVTNARGGRDVVTNARGWPGWGHQCKGVAGVGSPMQGDGRGGVTNAMGGRG